VDPVTLAATVVSSFLLPYVKKGATAIGEAVAKKFGDNVGGQVTDLAVKVWDKVKDSFTGEDELTTLKLFQSKPDTYQEPVKQILKEKIEKDPDGLGKELHQMVTAPVGNSGTGASIMGATIAGIVDLRGATISGSGQTFAGAIVNNPSPFGGSVVNNPPQPGEKPKE
jgi:hypothetical protein